MRKCECLTEMPNTNLTKIPLSQSPVVTGSPMAAKPNVSEKSVSNSI